ncbi:MAG TPA: hypothetical protein DE045_10955 [Oceanospirillaceae bacterium]|nr:hypothetical protein [Oceanospirillaceae bacterium]
MHDKYGTSQDPSCYPSSNQLINLLDIHSAEELEEAELVLTNFRLEQFSPNFNDLSFDYLKNIHHFLFQDIYPWAGQVRSIDISKGSTRFCIATNINQQALKRFQSLADAHYLQGLEIEDFIST